MNVMIGGVIWGRRVGACAPFVRHTNSMIMFDALS